MNTKSKTSAHVVFGLDKDQKPRAALIHPNELETAKKAAASQGFKIGRADSRQALQMAKQLPDAKVFATGHGLVPLVRKDIYDWLSKGLTLVDLAAEASAKDTAVPAGPETAADGAKTGGGGADKPAAPLKPDPKLWEQLTVGSLVVAPAGPSKDDGYWAACVTAVSKDGSKLTIKWRDFPTQPPVMVKRRAVALLLGNG